MATKDVSTAGLGSSVAVDRSLNDRRNNPVAAVIAAESNYLAAVLSDAAVQAKGDLGVAAEKMLDPNTVEYMAKTVAARGGMFSGGPKVMAKTMADILYEPIQRFGAETTSHLAAAGQRMAVGVSVGIGAAAGDATEDAVKGKLQGIFGNSLGTTLAAGIGAATASVVTVGVVAGASLLGTSIWRKIKCWFTSCEKPVFHHPSSWWTGNDTGSTAWMGRGPGNSIIANTRPGTYFRPYDAGQINCVSHNLTREWADLVFERFNPLLRFDNYSGCDRQYFLIYAPGGYLLNSPNGIKSLIDSAKKAERKPESVFIDLLSELFGVTGWFDNPSLKNVSDFYSSRLQDFGCMVYGRSPKGDDCWLTPSKLLSYSYKDPNIQLSYIYEDQNIQRAAERMLWLLENYVHNGRRTALFLPGGKKVEVKFPPFVFPYIENLAPLLLETLRAMKVPEDRCQECTRVYLTIDKDKVWGNLDEVYARRKKIYDTLAKYTTQSARAVLDWYFFFEPFGDSIDVYLPKQLVPEVVAKAPPVWTGKVLVNIDRARRLGKVKKETAARAKKAIGSYSSKYNPMVLKLLRNPVLITKKEDETPTASGPGLGLLVALAAAGYLATRS